MAILIRRNLMWLLATVIILLDLITMVFAFRLNVPRVLLPYHPNTQVQFQLEVTHPTDGCFTWRSSRTDVVSVDPIINVTSKGCSDRAIVTSRSRHTDQQSAVIFAEELGGGTILSCDVTVDIIHSIGIATTTKVLFVDAAPVLLVVEAFNKEGDRFSTLGSIPFDWFFTHNEGHSLHIISFAQSKYNAPPGIEELERLKKKGNIVLVEGVSTGSAQISARFHESYFSHIGVHTIELFVLANVMLVPSNDLYLLRLATVRYSAILLRKGRSEPVQLGGSSQYQIRVENSSICDLDAAMSIVTARMLGFTEITLYDKLVKPRAEFKPRSAHIYVVEPDSLQFSISGENWYLQLNMEYEIFVKLVDQLGNSIFISENAIFSTQIPETYFSILEKSKNGTYFRVISKRAGKISIKSAFQKMIAKDGRGVAISDVKGEQNLEILTPITIKPKKVLFPFHPTKRYKFQMKASGGSGHYHWSSADESIAKIEEKTGILLSGGLGETTIIAHDVHNILNRQKIKVIVAEPFEVQFAPSPVEAEIGSSLTLNIKLSGQTSDGLMPFTDCRHVTLPFRVLDTSIFIIDDKAIPTLSDSDGCTTVTLYAAREGDTQIILSSDRFIAKQDISAYSPLKINVKLSLLLTLGAGMGVTFEGGPRPWVLDNTKYTTSVAAKDAEVASAFMDGSKSFKAYCRNKIIDTEVILTVSNRKSTENPIPAVAIVKLKLCCGVPTSLTLSIPRLPSGELPVCPAFSHSIYFNAPFRLLLNAQGHCQGESDANTRPFNSVNSLDVEYKANEKLLRIEKIVDESSTIDSISMAIGKPRGITGPVEIEAIVAHFYDLASASPSQKVGFSNGQFRASLVINFVDFARANPPSLVLWNDRSVKGRVQIAGGSGHFWLDAIPAAERVTAQLHSNSANGELSAEIEILPKSTGQTTMTLFDLCIEGSRLDIDIKVIDIDGLSLETNEYVKTGGVIGLKVVILDADKRPFSGADISDIRVTLSPMGSPPADGTVNDVELVLHNSATHQVVRFPVKLKLSSELSSQRQQQATTAIVAINDDGSISNQATNLHDMSNISMTLNGIRQLLATFFECYQTFVMSTIILLISILLFAASYRYGLLYPLLKGPLPSNNSIKCKSPIQQIHPFGSYRTKPEMQDSWQHNASRSMLFNDSGDAVGGGTSPVFRRHQQSRYSTGSTDAIGSEPSDMSRHSAGTDDDPYLWTSNDRSRMHNQSLINRHYN